MGTARVPIGCVWHGRDSIAVQRTAVNIAPSGGSSPPDHTGRDPSAGKGATRGQPAGAEGPAIDGSLLRGGELVVEVVDDRAHVLTVTAGVHHELRDVVACPSGEVDPGLRAESHDGSLVRLSRCAGPAVDLI